MSISPISPIQRARAWVDDVARPQDRQHDQGEERDDTEVLAGIRDLSMQLDAMAGAIAELDGRVAHLASSQRQRERRLTNRLGEALQHQTDELLVTIDAWLPTEPEGPTEPESVAGTERRPRRRRWLLWALLL